MRGQKSLFAPVLLFIVTALAAFYTGDIVRIVEGAKSAQIILSQALLSAVWLSAAFVVIRLIHVFIWERLAHEYFGVPVPQLIRDMVASFVIMMACAGIVGVVFEQSVTGILATSGLIGIVIGFSLQTIILDVFTGLAIHVDRPFSIGEWIKMYGEMNGTNAKVLEINWRTTRLKTESNEMVIVPNSVLGKMIFTNFNQPELPTRFQVEVNLDFTVPVDRCRRLLMAAAKGTDGVLEDPAPVVLLGEANESGLKYIIRYWIKPWHPYSPTTASDKVLTNIVENLHYAGIGQGVPRLINLDSSAIRHQAAIDVESNRVSILRKVPLFRSLNEIELEQLAEAALPQYCLEGDTIILQGESGNSMYVLVEGLLNVYRAVDGKDTSLISRIQTGRYFGEMSLLTGEPRSATVRAALDSVILKIDKSVMTDLFTHRPELVDQLSRSLAEKRLADKNREALSAKSLEEETVSLAEQIKKKIIGFFNIVFHAKLPAVENVRV